MEKYCSKCKQIKLLTAFSFDKSTKDGRSYWCRLCAAANSRKNHALRKQSDPNYRRSKRNGWVKRAHGITLQEYEEKLAQQKYQCAICKVRLHASGHLTHLDHNHKTGKLRQFLCTNCNRGLGHFQDNYDLLLEAAQYLYTHNQNDELEERENDQ